MNNVISPQEKHLDIGFKMNIREWTPQSTATQTPFLLIHGLSSNARTWDGVARELAQAGHHVIAIDQRGHGRSEKLPVTAGYDFDTITTDIVNLIKVLGWEKPLIAGQSWGGNVVLAFGAKHPGIAKGLIFVDGGFFDVKKRAPVWEEAYEMFKPPHLEGVPRVQMQERMRQFQPEWSDEGIEATLNNFETRPDGTIKPWLSLDRHMSIFRAMWEQDPPSLYPQVQEPVLIFPAGNAQEDEKRHMVQQAQSNIPDVTVHWFDHTAHDIHVHRPVQLAQRMLNWQRDKNL
ncbi:MAG: alpha/beta hydrolase [Chloroflexota bacterium]